jgi:transcriptional regulator with XRE-family HTH domain
MEKNTDLPDNEEHPLVTSPSTLPKNKEEQKRGLFSALTDTLSTLSNEINNKLTQLYKVPLHIASTLVFSNDQLRRMGKEQVKGMEEAGAYLRDLRQVTGLTLSELSDAIDLSDQSLLKAAETGTATLSFELILRLSALLARHDPLPFILQLTRSYNPELWQVLENWGIGKIPLQFERERQFTNILRKHDDARELSDEQFEKLLALTASAFDLGLEAFTQKKANASATKE